MQMQMCSSIDGRLVTRHPVGWRKLCFNHPVVRCRVLTYAVGCFPSFPYCSHLYLSLCCVTVCIIGMSPLQRQRHFMTASHAPKALVSGCSHCNVNQMLRIRHIGYQSAVALSSPIVQISADMPIFTVRQYRPDTSNELLFVVVILHV